MIGINFVIYHEFKQNDQLLIPHEIIKKKLFELISLETWLFQVRSQEFLRAGEVSEN